MAAYSDQTQVSPMGLKQAVEAIENARDQVNTLKGEYLNYLQTELKTYWTTPNGIASVKKLEEFAESDIKLLVEQLSGNASRLNMAQATTSKMISD